MPDPMNNYLCMQGSLCVNAIYTTLLFTQTDPWSLANYTSFINYDTLDPSQQPNAWIGSTVDSNGNWTAAPQGS